MAAPRAGSAGWAGGLGCAGGGRGLLSLVGAGEAVMRLAAGSRLRRRLRRAELEKGDASSARREELREVARWHGAAPGAASISFGVFLTPAVGLSDAGQTDVRPGSDCLTGSRLWRMTWPRLSNSDPEQTLTYGLAQTVRLRPGADSDVRPDSDCLTRSRL